MRGVRNAWYVVDLDDGPRVVVRPGHLSPLPEAAVSRENNDCCPWQRDAKKKWRRATMLSEDLIVTWRSYESAPMLTRTPVTNVLKESDQAQLSRQFLPDDLAFAPAPGSQTPYRSLWANGRGVAAVWLRTHSTATPMRHVRCGAGPASGKYIREACQGLSGSIVRA
jgi:hypothetical protein